MTDWLTLDELSTYLRTPRSTLYKLCGRGILTPHKLGKRLLFDRDEVDRHIKAMRKKSPDVQGAVHGIRRRRAS